MGLIWMDWTCPFNASGMQRLKDYVALLWILFGVAPFSKCNNTFGFRMWKACMLSMLIGCKKQSCDQNHSGLERTLTSSVECLVTPVDSNQLRGSVDSLAEEATTVYPTSETIRKTIRSFHPEVIELLKSFWDNRTWVVKHLRCECGICLLWSPWFGELQEI